LKDLEEKENFQKKFSENVKLHPSTPEVTRSENQIAISSPKTPITRKRSPSSIYSGVNWCTERNKWHAVSRIGYKKITLGRHMTERGAALAFDEYARKLIKRLRKNLNFPDESDSVSAALSDQVHADEEKSEIVDGDESVFGPTTVGDYERARESEDDDDLEEE